MRSREYRREHRQEEHRESKPLRANILASVREAAEARITNGLKLDAVGDVEAEARLRVLSGLILADVAECMAQDDAGYPQVEPVEVLSQADRLIRLARERDEASARAERAIARAEKLRDIADRSAAEAGLYARRMHEAQKSLVQARNVLRRESDRADQNAVELRRRCSNCGLDYHATVSSVANRARDGDASAGG